MKIDNSRIFTADIYEVTNSTITDKDREALNYCDVVIGSYNYDDRITNKGVVVVYFKGKGYVPVWRLKNVFDYLNLEDRSFLDEQPFMPHNGTRFLKNVKHLFSFPGKTSLTELAGIQKLQSDKDDTCRGLEI